MKIDDLVPMVYSILLYKTQDYDCTKYDFKPPHHLKKQQDIFFEKNKFNLVEFLGYDIAQAKIRILITLFVNNRNIIKDCSNSDYQKLIYQLTHQEEEFELFLRKIKEDYSLYSRIEINKMFNKKEIPFFIFYYVQIFGKFKENSLSGELIKDNLKRVHKLMNFFECFDINGYKEKIINLNKEVALKG